MSLDVNKILMETLESSEAETQTDPNKVDNEGNPIVENTGTQADPNANATVADPNADPNAVVNEETETEGLPVGIYASAISAGLGAISLRNRLRSVYEMSDEAKRKLKKAGKIGSAGTAAAAGLGAAGYAAKNPEKAGEMAGEAKEKLKGAAETAKNWIANKGAK